MRGTIIADFTVAVPWVDMIICDHWFNWKIGGQEEGQQRQQLCYGQHYIGCFNHQAVVVHSSLSSTLITLVLEIIWWSAYNGVLLSYSDSNAFTWLDVNNSDTYLIALRDDRCLSKSFSLVCQVDWGIENVVMVLYHPSQMIGHHYRNGWTMMGLSSHGGYCPWIVYGRTWQVHTYMYPVMYRALSFLIVERIVLMFV